MRLRQYGDYSNEYVIAASFHEVIPVYYKIDEMHAAVKFVFQKSYYKDSGVQVDYRYVIVIYFDDANKILEIRYDSLKHSPTTDNRTILLRRLKFVDI